MTNNLKTVALLGFLSALVWWIGIALFPNGGIYIGLLFAVGINAVAYFFSDKMAIMSARAQPVPDNELPEVQAILNRLAQYMDMPKPRLYFINSPQPNAFATGRNPKHAVVAVTAGIIQLLNRDELEGVIAHELAHVRNRDILISSIAAMLAAALSIFGRMALFSGGGRGRDNNPIAGVMALLSIFLAPIAAMIIRMAISRSREFEADQTGAMITGRPLNLASALAKISQGTAQIPMRVNPAVSQLFIADPLKALNARQTMGKLFSTHPPIEERIARLTAQSSGMR
ncbi:MAG: zinc metalloprotease HtpX [Acidimicrobiia bacterium]|nr:zinc metalloprotease HtpX [Acidimicrobiia bacterium]